MPMPKNGLTYYWHIYNFTPDMDKYKVIHAITKAYSVFQRGLDLVPPVGNYLNIESTNDIKKADFILSFGAKKHKIIDGKKNNRDCFFEFDGEGRVLAHVPSNDKFGIHFDEDEDWTKQFLIDVATHEIGHTFFMGHTSENPRAVMRTHHDGNPMVWTQDDQNSYNHSMRVAKPLAKQMSENALVVGEVKPLGICEKAKLAYQIMTT